MGKVILKKAIRYSLVFGWIGVVATFIAGCASMEGSYRDARRLDTISAYEEFINKYPDSPYTSVVRESLNTLKEEKAFKEAEQKNSIAAYREFAQKYNDSKYTEEAKRRIAESDEEAFRRAYYIGTIQAFKGFIESYPDSKCSNEVKDRIQWLEKLKIGVVTNTSNFPGEETERAGMENKINHKLKAILEKFGGQVVFFKSKEEIDSKDLSALIVVNYNRHETNPQRSEKIAGEIAPAILFGGLIGGLIAYLDKKDTFDLIFGPENVITEYWSVTIKNGSLKKDLNYKKELHVEKIDEIFSNLNFFEKTREAEMITWLAKSDIPQASFSKVALENTDIYFRWKTVQTLDSIELYGLALKDENMMVRQEAAKALKNLTGKEFSEEQNTGLTTDSNLNKIEKRSA